MLAASTLKPPGAGRARAAGRSPRPASAWLRALAQAQALTQTLVMALAGAPALADEVSAGRAKAQACAVCHGVLGLAVHPQAPHLAGQPADYLRAQLRAYRDGTRKNEMMTLMARPLRDDDIDQLAAWFSSLRVEVVAPP